MKPSNPPPPVAPRYIRDLHYIHADTLCPFIGYYIHCWLKNGQTYWFCVSSVDRENLEGYAWRQGQWQPARLPMKSIDNFY